MQHSVIPIAGMHCRSCELLIDEHLRNVPGVKTVRVKFHKGCATIGYEDTQRPNDDAIEEAVRNAGYTVGTSAKAPWLSRNLHDYKNLGLAALIILALYFLARSTGLLDVSFQTENLSLPFAVVIGLVAGISTCMAIVGGLILGLSARYSETHPEATATQKFRPHVFFNLGRIAGYALLGGLLGSLGGFLQLSNIALAVLTIGVGVVMVMLGLKLTSISPRLKNASITLPSSLAKMFGLNKNQSEYSHKSAMLTGALTFFLPCGFTQAMQLFAISTGSFTNGALALGLFAVGTAPALLSIGGLTSVLKGIVARRFYVTVGLAVLLFGIFNVRNGLAITGFTGGGSDSKKEKTAVTDVVDGYQIVRMKQKTSSYSPNSFTVQKGIPVKWIITSESQYSCASSIIMPTYNIAKNLTLGENTIEFTPKETGRINFSCSMGMYRGSFTVVDQGAPTSSTQGLIERELSPRVAAAATGGGSCGSGGCGGGGAKPTPSTAPPPTVDSTSGVQKITAQANGSLSPNEFTVKAGKPVEWTVTSVSPPQGCMTAFVNRQLGLFEYQAESGDTVMSFTPTQASDYDITCAMGMWRATIHVTS